MTSMAYQQLSIYMLGYLAVLLAAQCHGLGIVVMCSHPETLLCQHECLKCQLMQSGLSQGLHVVTQLTQAAGHLSHVTL